MERYPEFSPDGRWIALRIGRIWEARGLHSSLPGAGDRRLRSPQRAVLNQLGPEPGTRSVYRDPYAAKTYSVYSVEIRESDGDLIPARPVKLFARQYSGTSKVRQGDVTPDGRLLMIPVPGEDVITASLDALMPSRISVVHNWFTELTEKVPANR